jgi:sporulation protein YlmC with PRC-barrel domain
MSMARMCKQWVLRASVIAVMVAPAWVLAKSSGQEQKNITQQRQSMSQERMQSQDLKAVRTSKLIGQKVKGSDGETLGTVYDLVLTPDHERVSYLALSSGGVWGVGDTLYAIPWSALQHRMGNTCTLNISKQELRTKKGFKDDQWPSSVDAQWSSMDQSKMQPTRESSQQKRQMAMENRDVQYRRVTKLSGMDVKNYEGQDVGSVEEFVVTTYGMNPSMRESGKRQSEQMQSRAADEMQAQHQSEEGTSEQMQGGHVLYAVISLGGFWGFGEECALVPANAVNFQSQREYARLDADKTTLQAIAFDPDKWPDLSSRSYARQIYERFDEQPYWVVLGYMPQSQEQETASQEAWAADSQYNRNFDAKTVKSIEGTIESVGTFQPAMGVREGLRLRVKTDEGKTVTVYAGPQWFAQQKSFSVKAGDKIKVMGSQTKVRNRSVIMSTKIESGGKTLELRASSGEPKWEKEAMQSGSHQTDMQSTDNR